MTKPGPYDGCMEWLEASTENCPVQRTLDVVGEKWTLLILRDAVNGVRRFDDFHRHIGLSEAVLSDRLRKLAAAGILKTVPYQEPGTRSRNEYHLTRKGWDLWPVLMALSQWGETYALGPEGTGAGHSPHRLRRSGPRRHRVLHGTLHPHPSGRHRPTGTRRSPPHVSHRPRSRAGRRWNVGSSPRRTWRSNSRGRWVLACGRHGQRVDEPEDARVSLRRPPRVTPALPKTVPVRPVDGCRIRQQS